MHRPSARLAVGLIASVALAACAGGGPAASPSTAPGSASPGPDAATYWLRVTTTQAIPPLSAFAEAPLLVITGDGVLVTTGPVVAMYPGPLLPNLLGRQVNEAGRAWILQSARDLGLLAGRTDFGTRGMLAGGVTGRIELTVDGSRVTFTGDPSAQIECITTPCDPGPGTPEAFGAFWRSLVDTSAWPQADLGPEATYVPSAYSILVGPAPVPEPSLPQAPADWPLATPLASFGGPVANGTARCGTVSGADAATLRPVLAAANQLTPWVQDPATNATFGLTVRPLVPGEDACREVFGPG